MEAEVAGLKAQTNANGDALRDIWEIIRKLSAGESKQDLILYRIDELTRKLAEHDVAETTRHATHEDRITTLERARSESKGAWRVVAAQGALVGALVSGGLTALLEHFLASGKP